MKSEKYLPVTFNGELLGSVKIEIKRKKPFFSFVDPQGDFLYVPTPLNPETKASRNDLRKAILQVFKELNKEESEELMNKVLIETIKLLEKPKQKSKEEDKDDKEEPINYELGEKFLKNPDLLIDYFEFLEKEKGYVKDIIAKDVILKVCLSAYTDEPLNLFLKGPSSIGKTFGVVTIVKLFPEEDVILIGRLSPTALIHTKGEHDEEREAIIVDLTGKILVFLEKPKKETLEMLLPILSHDTKEIEYRITDKGSKGLAAKRVIIRGWPATIFCTTEIEGTDDLKTRSLLITPEISPEKTREAMKSYARQFLYPKQNEESYKEKEIKEAIKILKKERNKVIIPYIEKLAEVFPNTTHEEMRNFKKYIALLSLNAFLHKYNRIPIEIGEEKYILANGMDYEITNLIFEAIAPATRSGVPNHVREFYEKVLCAIEDDQERYTRNIIRKHLEVFKKPLGASTWYNYKRLLEDVGWILTDNHEEKKNIKIIRLLRKGNEKLFQDVPTDFEAFFPMKELQNWISSYIHSKHPDFIKSVLHHFYNKGSGEITIEFLKNCLSFTITKNDTSFGTSGNNLKNELEEKKEELKNSKIEVVEETIKDDFEETTVKIEQEKRMKLILHAISKLEEEYDYAKFDELRDILKREFKLEYPSKLDLLSDLNLLKKNGEIYEPKHMCYKVVR